MEDDKQFAEYLERLQNDGRYLGEIPESMRNEDICALAVESDGRALQFVPDRSMSYELCQKAVRSKPQALQYVPDWLKTEDLVHEAVGSNGMMLGFVPERLKSPELCDKAVERDGRALQYVPHSLLSSELFSKAAKNTPEAIMCVPQELMNVDMCLEAIAYFPEAIRYIPKGKRCYQECFDAVSGDGQMLVYAMESFRGNCNIIEAALSNDGTALRHLPKQYVTPEYCHMAVSENGAALEFVPDTFLTPSLVRLALSREKEDAPEPVLKYVPERLMDKDFFLQAVRQNGAALAYVPEASRSEDLCLTALMTASPDLVEANVPDSLKGTVLPVVAKVRSYTENVMTGARISVVPEEYRTRAMYEESVRRDPSEYPGVPDHFRTRALRDIVLDQPEGLQYIPFGERTPEACRTAVSECPKNIRYVPDKFVSDELCVLAIEKEPMVLESLPLARRTPLLCLKAVSLNPEAMAYVPRDTDIEGLAIEALEKGAGLREIPEALRTDHVCLCAVTRNGTDLQFVPQERKSREVCLEALRNTQVAMLYFPESVSIKELTNEIRLHGAVKETYTIVRSNKDEVRTWIEDVMTNAMGGQGTFRLVCDLDEQRITREHAPFSDESEKKPEVIDIYSNPDTTRTPLDARSAAKYLDHIMEKISVPVSRLLKEKRMQSEAERVTQNQARHSVKMR